MSVPSHINYLKITVPSSANNIRIRKWILEHYRNLVRSKENLHRSFERREISVNDEPVEETRILKEGDVVEIRYDKQKEEQERMKSIPVNVIYEDQDIAVVWKSAGQNFGLFEKALQYTVGSLTDEGIRQKIWCVYTLQKAASGLLIVAKTEEIRKKLLNVYNAGAISMLMRVICHGNVPRNLLSLLPDIETPSSVISADHNGDSEEELPPEYVNTRRNAKLMLKSLDIVSVTRSNDADYLTTLDLHLRTPLSSVGLRSLFFHHTSHPIVGSSTYTKYLKSNRDKGLCASLIRIEFTHPVTGELLCLEGQEPEKFELIRKREQKFWQRKVDQAVAAMRKAGIKVNGTEGLDEIETGNTKKPLAYILGEKEFYRLNFKVSEECLIPRPSTETLVDAALMALKDRSAEKGCRILDIGTGCGNLLLAILSNTPNATGVGIDVSSGALNLAETNAKMLGIDNRAQFIKQDMAQLGSDVDENMLYDIIVCNPPYLDVDYISTKQQNQMSVLKYEPSEALFANDEGYEWYMILSKVIPLVARPGSRVILECGKGMMDRVKAIWADWKVVDILKDKQGWDRCLILTKE